MAVTAKPQAPMFTKRALFTLIWPLLLEQTLSVTMGMADTLMVAGVGEAAVSSVSLVDSLNILIIQILSALATGGAVISSQYLGRRDGEKAAKSAAQLYTVLAVSTIAVMLVILVLSRPILRIVFGRIDDDVMRFSQTYFLISAISYPCEQGFVPENVFLERLPEIAKNAIADACTGSNPRQPSQEEMEKLLKCCYYDTEVDF